MNTILLRGARQLLTLRGPAGPRRGTALGELGIVQDGAVLIRDGRIDDLGQGRRVENLASARGAREIDVTGRVVLPGFVDSHTHLTWGPPRLAGFEVSSGRRQPLDRAAMSRAALACAQTLRTSPSRTLERQARERLAMFVRHGTTTLEAQSGGFDHTSDLKALRVLEKLTESPLDVTPTYCGAHALPSEYEGRAHEYVEWIISEMLPLVRRRRLAASADVWCGRGALSIDDARRYLVAARAAGFALRVHAEQFSHDGGARLAVEVGAASAGHLQFADRDDIAILAQSSTIATLTPGAAFHLGLDRRPPGRALVDQGAAVALATDFSPVTSPTCSMPMVLSLACTDMRMTPAEAVSAATINGAHALGCADRVGSLEEGKYADLTVFDVPDYREIPYTFGVNLVSMTIKRGVVLYRRGDVEWQAR